MITDEVFLEILDTIKKQSTCSYYKTGALIVKDNRIVSMGYNGTPPGFPQCNELQEVLEWLVENPKKALSLINPITDLQLEKLLKNETFKKFPLFSKYSEVRIRPIFSRLVWKKMEGLTFMILILCTPDTKYMLNRMPLLIL